MRAVVQRVKRAEVRVAGQVAGRVGPGLLVLAAVGAKDTPQSARQLAEKIAHLRIMDDEQGRMNRSILDSGGGILCVSQFTLYGDARRGRRPSYVDAAPPQSAEPLYDKLLKELRALAAPRQVAVECGQFRAMMEVELVNDGPVTVLLDTDMTF